VLFYNWLFVFKIKDIFEKKSPTQKCGERSSFLYIFTLIYLLHVWFVLKIERIFANINPAQSVERRGLNYYYQWKDGHSRSPLPILFIALTFENHEQFFFYEILIKTKKININDCCFHVIKNQTNHDYLFQRHRQ